VRGGEGGGGLGEGGSLPLPALWESERGWGGSKKRGDGFLFSFLSGGFIKKKKGKEKMGLMACSSEAPGEKRRGGRKIVPFFTALRESKEKKKGGGGD